MRDAYAFSSACKGGNEMNTRREYKDTVYRMLFKEPDNPDLELKVQIININPGMNEELKAKCPALREYVIYVEKVRSYAKEMPLKEAVERAIEECIRDDVLRDFLLQQKAEVVKVSIYEYDEEKEMKLIRAAEREVGEEIGKEIGIEVIAYLNAGKSCDDIANQLNIQPEEVERIKKRYEQITSISK